MVCGYLFFILWIFFNNYFKDLFLEEENLFKWWEDIYIIIKLNIKL